MPIVEEPLWMEWWSAANFSHNQTQPKPASNRLDGIRQRIPVRRPKKDPAVRSFVAHRTDPTIAKGLPSSNQWRSMADCLADYEGMVFGALERSRSQDIAT
jgi:hypothetical protein